MENNEKKNSISAMMEASMDKIRQMVDSNTVVGEQPDKVGAAAAAGVRVEPMAFLVVKDGVTRMLPVGTPAITTVDRVVEMVPQVMDRVESFIDKKREKADF